MAEGRDYRDRKYDTSDTKVRSDLREEGSSFGGVKREDRRDDRKQHEPYGRPNQFKPRGSRPNHPRIDRKKICPLLLRVFPEFGKHHDLSAYDDGNLPTPEISVYTWKDTSLRELSDLIRPNIKDIEKDAVFEFSFVYPEPKGDLAIRPAGTVGKYYGPDDNKTLTDLSFVTGDYLDVAVLPASEGRRRA